MFTKVWDFLQGKKTYLGGVAFILTGLATIFTSYSNNQGFSHDGWVQIIQGWTIIAAKSALTKKSTEPLTEPPPKPTDNV